MKIILEIKPSKFTYWIGDKAQSVKTLVSKTKSTVKSTYRDAKLTAFTTVSRIPLRRSKQLPLDL